MAGILAERRNRLIALKKMREQGSAPTVEEKTCPSCGRALADSDLAGLIGDVGGVFGLVLGVTGAAAAMLFVAILSAVKAVGG